MNKDKLKSIISKKANGNNNLSAQLYQMYFFEHILDRLSKSQYKNNIILKGGLLLSSIIGDDERTTKDMDATLKSLPLERENVIQIVNDILNIDLDDGITFKIEDVKDIREESEYGGFKINILAMMLTLKVYLAIELTTGDKITPREIEYNYNCIFENKKIDPSELILHGILDKLPNVDIIPSNILLIKTEMELVSTAGREKLLANYFDRNKEFFSQYTHVIFDTNPNLGVINQNIFYFVESIILVSDVSLNAIQGAELFTFLWEENIEDLGIRNNIKALIINNFDKRINLAKDLQDYYLSEDDFKDILVETPIPGSVAMKDTSLNHSPIVVLQPTHQAASAVRKIVKELILREVF